MTTRFTDAILFQISFIIYKFNKKESKLYQHPICLLHNNEIMSINTGKLRVYFVSNVQ